MAVKKLSASSIVFFLSAGIFLLLIQFGFISPMGYVKVTYFQYTLLFWLSIIAFILSIADLFRRFPQYAKWSTGYSGYCVRTARISGIKRDYFIRGSPGTTVREAILDEWPFESEKKKSDWQVFDEEGNDISNLHLEETPDNMIVLFHNE
ncbi:MAG: hypothetical protein ACFFCP_00925 [Promethearchaeota archaeon]